MPTVSNPAVSVIIPTFNVESFIERTFSSLVAQSLSNIEFIFVDDASDDGTVSKLESLIGNDDRFKIIKLNVRSGGGYARNIGVQSARGEYLTFMDSDDVVSFDYYETMYSIAKQDNADLVINGEVRFVFESSDKKSYIHYFTDPALMYSMQKRSFTPAEFPELMLTCFLWNRLYKKSWFLDSGIKIPVGRKFAEDLLPCVQSTVLANKVSFISRPMYSYYQRAGSLTDHLNRDQDKKDLLIAFQETRDFLLKSGAYAWAHYSFFLFIFNIIFPVIENVENKVVKKHYCLSLKKTLSSEEVELLKKMGFCTRFPKIFQDL